MAILIRSGSGDPAHMPGFFVGWFLGSVVSSGRDEVTWSRVAVSPSNSLRVPEGDRWSGHVILAEELSDSVTIAFYLTSPEANNTRAIRTISLCDYFHKYFISTHSLFISASLCVRSLVLKQVGMAK